MALEDYKEIVGAAAGFVTFCQMFSGMLVFTPLPMRISDAGLISFAIKQFFKALLISFTYFCFRFLCRDIYKSGSTNKIPVMPFMGGFVISILFYQHALILNDTVMKTVNLGGTALNIFYLLFYYLWTSDNKKPKFYKDACKGAALIFILLLYVQVENAEKVEFRFGMIVTLLLMFLIASPLFSLGEVIRTGSTESLPFPMIISGFIVSAHWLLYGIIIKNNFVIFQNVVGSLLCLIQLSLFVIYPSKKKEDKKLH